MTNKTMTVSFAINDDNGEWDYKVRRVDFDDVLTVDSQYRPAQAEIKNDVLYIGYVSVKVIERIPWHGSMMFEGVVISIEDAQRIAEYLRERGYTVDNGVSEIFDAWEENEAIVFVDAGALRR